MLLTMSHYIDDLPYILRIDAFVYSIEPLMYNIEEMLYPQLCGNMFDEGKN